ncbi:unnamed protein product [Adineta steineri]|uniref:Methyltransferase FkbM domain-containing protein n=1 Tax=Adineta steineri TaxID=433720 RepID=A0A819S0S9_9BILA|nr:unnamed protein product [Adineta steineri]CAF0869010.1 unnamed protein product [Adineta steineri]CAF4028349.1 unnamed protein product [Adineta steineri]CAF4054093.1 unnamed protein product [Adineta steineri]
MTNKAINLTIIVIIIIIIGFGAVYIHFPIYRNYQILAKFYQRNRTNRPAGFGGGVVVFDGNKKQFVTMVQRSMFTLNAQGYIPMPDTIKRVWIDVGSNIGAFLAGDSVYSAVYWPNRIKKSARDEFRDANDIMGIAIDPNSIYYEGLSKIPRIIPIIAAIYTVEGTQIFYEYPVDGCSSLLEPNSALDPSYLGDNVIIGCHHVKKMTGVSTIRLETILSLIDPRLDVEFLKIDAQGTDLEVAQSAGAQLKRIGKIVIETQKQVSNNNKTNNFLYKNQISAQESVKWMAEHDFLFDEKQSFPNNLLIQEFNYVFNNRYRNNTT